MPQFLEDKLKATAAKKGFTGRKADHYVYGALNNMGAMRGNQVSAKGAAMQRKHEEHLQQDRGKLHSLSSMRMAAGRGRTSVPRQKRSPARSTANPRS